MSTQCKTISLQHCRVWYRDRYLFVHQPCNQPVLLLPPTKQPPRGGGASANIEICQISANISTSSVLDSSKYYIKSIQKSTIKRANIQICQISANISTSSVLDSSKYHTISIQKSNIEICQISANISTSSVLDSSKNYIKLFLFWDIFNGFLQTKYHLPYFHNSSKSMHFC